MFAFAFLRKCFYGLSSLVSAPIDCDFCLHCLVTFSDADVSRAVVRVLEEKGVLLNKDGATGLAAIMSAQLTPLKHTRYYKYKYGDFFIQIVAMGKGAQNTDAT